MNDPRNMKRRLSGKTSDWQSCNPNQTEGGNLNEVGFAG
jgi:hypothetical protein